MAANYYMILGVSPDSTREQVKSAYRARALELHPDLTGGDSGPFQSLQEAYSVLGDPERRRDYDRRVRPPQSLAARGRRPPEPIRAPARAEPLAAADLGQASLARSFETHHPSFDEIFERLWDNFDQVTRPKAEQVRGLMVEIPLTPAAARRGGSIEITVPARADCPTCRGTGHVAFYECWRCAGHGSLTGELPVAVRYPPLLASEHWVQVPLDELGIHNFYLSVRFVVTAEAG